LLGRCPQRAENLPSWLRSPASRKADYIRLLA
jgi:hypothetical protein